MKTFKIKDVCHLEKGQQIDTSLLNDIHPYKYINGGMKESGYYTLYNTEGETVLVSEGGASCGYVNYINERFWCGCHCYKLTECKILPKYLYYALKGNQNKLMALRTGSAMPNIKKASLQEMKLKINENFLEQKDTVKKLDLLQSIITHRRQQLAKLDELVKARFVEMFGKFNENPMKWPVVSFADIAIIDGNMTTDYARYAHYPHIGVDSIEKDTGTLKGYRTVAEDRVISGKYVFTKTHIIYSKIRPNLNKVALPDFDGLCSADAYPILPIDEKCNRVFLAYNMRSPFFLDYILQFCKRTNLPKVNRKELYGFKTPLPPINLQNQFASFVYQVDKSKSAVQKALNESQTLFDSLMQQYFG